MRYSIQAYTDCTDHIIVRRITAIAFCILVVGCPGSHHIENSKIDLIECAKAGNVKELDRILSRGALPDIQDRFGMSALFYACINGQIEAAKCLVKWGADIELKDNIGYTPLLSTVASQRFAALKFLLEAGANANARDYAGFSALDIAVNNCDAKSVSLLLTEGAQANAADPYGWMPLHNILRIKECDMNTRIDIVKSLLLAGADPNTSRATTGKSVDAADSAVGIAGPDLFSKYNSKVTTSFAIAEEFEFHEIVRILNDY